MQGIRPMCKLYSHKTGNKETFNKVFALFTPYSLYYFELFLCVGVYVCVYVCGGNGCAQGPTPPVVTSLAHDFFHTKQNRRMCRF